MFGNVKISRPMNHYNTGTWTYNIYFFFIVLCRFFFRKKNNLNNQFVLHVYISTVSEERDRKQTTKLKRSLYFFFLQDFISVLFLIKINANITRLQFRKREEWRAMLFALSVLLLLALQNSYVLSLTSVYKNVYIIFPVDNEFSHCEWIREKLRERFIIRKKERDIICFYKRYVFSFTRIDLRIRILHCLTLNYIIHPNELIRCWMKMIYLGIVEFNIIW